MLSAEPILAAFPEAPPDAPPPPEDPPLQAARTRRGRKTPTGTTLRLGMRALLGVPGSGPLGCVGRGGGLLRELLRRRGEYLDGPAGDGVVGDDDAGALVVDE